MSGTPRISHAGRKTPVWQGRPRAYQAEAQRLFSLEKARAVLPWSYITLKCDVDMCLLPGCMELHAPKHLEYPAGVCVYCGMPAYQKDHLLPKPMTGEALRKYVLVVPACGQCNAAIGDLPDAHVGRRRRKAQLSIQRKNKQLLTRPHKDGHELRQLGPHLRSVAIKNNNKAKAVRLRLSWPEDPHYDLKAFQRAGIEDPVALDLCEHVSMSLLDQPYWKEGA